MSKHWESLAARDGQNTADEFEAAAYRLISEQVLYHSDKSSRIAYYLVDRYEREFSQVLAPMGVDIEVNKLHRYIYARPRHAKAGTVTVTQTLLALVLRSIYDEAVRSGRLSDNGEVLCDTVELDEKYRLATGRELPSKGEFDSLMRQFKRWGIAKRADEQVLDELDGEGDTQQYILIRPAIVDVLGETALQRLGQWAQYKRAGEAVIETEQEEVPE
ncbi:MAG TPA: DUF4194 domain-containing protein [Halothiobacillus sp.]|nr:DUF4194 domain-containing protein [Halothiobacillus sp.]